MSNIWKFLILAVSSYLVGNVTFARLFARTRNNDDITTHGSGNPGTMNMLRTHGLWLAVVTLVFDALKSVVCCLWGYFWLKADGAYLANLAIYTAGVSCIVGHCFPALYKFKGGKGIATGFGMACVARPILIPVLLAVFLFIFLMWRIASLSSLTTVVVYLIGDSIFLLVNGFYGSFVLLLFAVALIFFQHRKNLQKLFDNKENKIDLNEAVQKDKDFAKEQKEKREKIKKSKMEKLESNSLTTDSGVSVQNDAEMVAEESIEKK